MPDLRMARRDQVTAHLLAPQFTDGAGRATGQGRVPFLVAPGRPRWLGYVFYLGAFLVGVALALGLVEAGNEAGSDLLRILGVVAIFGALLGAWEVWRGRPFSPREIAQRLRR